MDWLAVEPDLAKVWEIPNEGGLLETTVGHCAKDMAAGPDVGEHIRIAKNGDRGLRIQKYPGGIEASRSVCQHETVLHKGSASRCRSSVGRAVRRVMAFVVTAVARYADVRDPVHARRSNVALRECQSAALRGWRGCGLMDVVRVGRIGASVA